jgi:cation transport ATPase
MRLSFLTILFVAFGIGAQAQTDTLRIRTSAVCDMCKKTIEEGMAFTKGVKYASLDVETKLLTVAINPKKTDAVGVRKAVNALGYDADDSPADPKAYDKLHACCKKDSH